MNHDAFIRRIEAGIPYYTCSALEKISGMHHGFSTRHGRAGSSSEFSFDLGQAPWSISEMTRENRRRFISALHLEEMALATRRQVHSDKFIIIREKCDQGNPSEADALITQVRKVALAVMVADCLPILMADPVTRVIAAVHAGWRGILARIVEATISGMKNSFGVRESDLIVAIGPGIRSCCFEVGRDVFDLFEKTFRGTSLAKPHPDHPEKWLLDLRAALDIQLSSSGINKTSIYDLGACTCCNTKEFFSYRREGARAGRMMAVIAMDS
jgi:polyphenol oxidase